MAALGVHENGACSNRDCLKVVGRFRRRRGRVPGAQRRGSAECIVGLRGQPQPYDPTPTSSRDPNVDVKMKSGGCQHLLERELNKLLFAVAKGLREACTRRSEVGPPASLKWGHPNADTDVCRERSDRHMDAVRKDDPAGRLYALVIGRLLWPAGSARLH